MVVQITSLDGQLAIPLPQSLANQVNLLMDTSVDVSLRGSDIVVARVGEKPPTLAELVSGITDENLHGETNWGSPAGKEVW